MMLVSILVVMAVSLADPIALGGYVAAGALLRDWRVAIGAGLLWAAAMNIVAMHLNPGSVTPGSFVAGRLLGGLVASAIVFWLARQIRKNRATPKTPPLE